MDSMNIPPNVVKTINHDSVTINGGTYEQPLIMPNQINFKKVPKAYDAGDMLDLSDLAVNDVKWLNLAIKHLKAEFYHTKDFIQSNYKVHDSYFEQLDEFFGMYEHLANDRLKEKEQVVVVYQNEWEKIKGGSHNA